MAKYSAYRILPVLCLVLLWTYSVAQPFVTRIYTANHGLPDAYTLSIYQDQQGYLWIGTYTGLSRFDGQKFTTIEVKNQSAALAANVMLQDHLGRLWIYYKKSVGLLDKDTVMTFPTDDGRHMNYVFDVIQLQDQRIWALVDQGAYEFTGQQWKRLQFPQPFHGLNCRQVIETPEGLYFNFEKHIALRDHQGMFTILSPADVEAFYVNMQKSGNRIYANRVNGLIKMENGQVHELFTKQLSQTTNYNFIVDSQDRFWISTEDFGILVSGPGNESHLDDTISLPFNLSTFLFEDRDHNVWATNYEGLIKISRVDFHRYDKSSGDEFENIRCLTTDPQGNLYFATSGLGVFKNVQGSATPEALSFAAVRDFIPDVVDGMDFDGEGALWVITRGNKVIRYKDHSASELTSLLPKSAQGLRAVHFDPNQQRILIASDKLYIGDARGFQSWGEYFNTSEIVQPRFICVRKDGSLIVNTSQDGVFLIRGHKELTNISAQLGIVESSKEIRIYEDPEDGIWVTKTGEGIAHFIEKEEGVFEKAVVLSTQDGLPNNSVISAVFDRKKKLWLTTLSGVATVTRSADTLNTQFRVDRVGEELGSTVLNWGASGSNIACDHNDNIWVSTFHELIRFDADKGNIYKKPPGISIESIRLNLKETDWTKYTDSCTGYFGVPFNPVLTYAENSFVIKFQGISFSENPGLLYSYVLSSATTHAVPDSLDASWSEPTASNDVSFVKLPPGKYVFAVKTREAGSSWSKPATFYFTILPPFWNTWWFRLSCAIMIILLIWIAIRFRIKQIRRKAELRNQLNELEMKALKAQMNPHFIYNALNSIQSLVMDGKQQESVKYMSKFARLLRQVLEHSGANLITLDKELQTTELYVQLETLRMNAKLDYTAELDEQILAEKELVPPLILQPFVENALWHGLSRKEGEKKLSVQINADDTWLNITITDNGIGRQKAEELKSGNLEHPRSMGMDITGKRLQIMNVERATALEIRDLLDTDGKVAGTQVRIKLRRQSGARNTG